MSGWWTSRFVVAKWRIYEIRKARSPSRRRIGGRSLAQSKRDRIDESIDGTGTRWSSNCRLFINVIFDNETIEWQSDESTSKIIRLDHSKLRSSFTHRTRQRRRAMCRLRSFSLHKNGRISIGEWSFDRSTASYESSLERTADRIGSFILVTSKRSLLVLPIVDVLSLLLCDQVVHNLWVSMYLVHLVLPIIDVLVFFFFYLIKSA